MRKRTLHLFCWMSRVRKMVLSRVLTWRHCPRLAGSGIEGLVRLVPVRTSRSTGSKFCQSGWWEANRIQVLRDSSVV